MSNIASNWSILSPPFAVFFNERFITTPPQILPENFSTMATRELRSSKAPLGYQVALIVQRRCVVTVTRSLSLIGVSIARPFTTRRFESELILNFKRKSGPTRFVSLVCGLLDWRQCEQLQVPLTRGFQLEARQTIPVRSRRKRVRFAIT